MSPTQVIEIGRDLLLTAILISLPALLVSLVVGLVISVLQTITSIQEQTLSFVPRLIAVGLVLVFTMAWVLQVASSFTARMLWQATEAIR
ncbi:MAG: flagellar biosynthetic protein FliQ [Planctomycetes bacterium]|nr:flagellar biosynthetic protein FliQ [Planctomycetota bacterium]